MKHVHLPGDLGQNVPLTTYCHKAWSLSNLPLRIFTYPINWGKGVPPRLFLTTHRPLMGEGNPISVKKILSKSGNKERLCELFSCDQMSEYC